MYNITSSGEYLLVTDKKLKPVKRLYGCLYMYPNGCSVKLVGKGGNEITLNTGTLSFIDGVPKCYKDCDLFIADVAEVVAQVDNYCNGVTIDSQEQDPQIETHSYTKLCFKDVDGTEHYYLVYGIYDEVSQVEVSQVKPIGDAPTISLDDLQGMVICDIIEETKPKLEPFYKTITDNNKHTWLPAVHLDTIRASLIDSAGCNFVRVTFVCPDGVVGCTLLSPSLPSKTFNLGQYGNVTEICVQVVAETPGTDVKLWQPVAPIGDIVIDMDGIS